MLWSFVQTFGKQGIGFVVFLWLTTMLEPEDFGLLGMALVVTSLVQAFSEVGFGPALIQRKELKPSHISSVFIFNILVGALLTFIGVMVSGYGARLFRIHELEPIIAALSVGFLINGLSLTHMAIAYRKMKFRELALREMVATSVGGMAGIAMAYSGYGVWSLVAQLMVSWGVATVLILIMVNINIKLREASMAAVRELWSYSSSLFLFNIIKYFTTNMDRFFIGYLLGPVALGLYAFAWRMVIFPTNAFVSAINRYLFPKYSRLQDDIEEIEQSYMVVLKIVNMAIFPVLVFVVIGAPLVVPYLWGEKWLAAVPIMQILAVLAFLRSIISPVGQVMKALGRPQWLLRWSIYITIVVLLFIWYGATVYGLEGATWGITLAYITGLPINFIILKRLIGLSPVKMAQALYPSTIAAIVASLPALWGMWSRAYSSIENMVLLFGGGIILYGLTVAILDRRFIIKIIRRLKHKLIPA